jgi:hypothetical protein
MGRVGRRRGVVRVEAGRRGGSARGVAGTGGWRGRGGAACGCEHREQGDEAEERIRWRKGDDQWSHTLVYGEVI